MASHDSFMTLMKAGGLLCQIVAMGIVGGAGSVLAEESQETPPPTTSLATSPMDLFFPVERLKTTSLTIQGSKWSSFDPTLMSVYFEEAEAETISEDEAVDGVETTSPIGDHITAWRLDVQGGLFLNRQLNPTLGVGLLRLKGNALGRYSLEVSEEIADMWILPLNLSLMYRFDYSWDQLLVPYAGFGGDGWLWREETSYARTSGVKWGVHGTVGSVIRLNFMETSGRWSTTGRGTPSDVGLIVEASYAWVDSFGAGGLNFSGPSISGGLYFSF